VRIGLLMQAGQMEIADVPDPSPGPRQVTMRVEACGVCTSDLRKFNTLDDGQIQLPARLGHEFVGYVEKVGSEVTELVVGDRILGDGYRGYSEIAEIDLDVDPPLHVPNPLFIPPGVPARCAIFTEPLADCIHAVSDILGNPTGQKVVVVGVGTMGLMLVRLLADLGNVVTAVDGVTGRLEVASRWGGAVTTLRSSADIQDISPEAIVIATGDQSLVTTCVEMVAMGGAVLLFGGFPRPARIVLDPNIIHYREIRLLGSEWVGVGRNGNMACYRRAIDLIASGKVPVMDLVSETYSLAEIQAAFGRAAHSETLKVVIVP
jgi:threonine dehydrogenase-like Zn-dependent dehydrogenase